MSYSNTKVVNILDNDNWSNALLIKDLKGNLAPLKKEKVDKDNDLLIKQVLPISDTNTAPKDANFMPMQNISGSSQDKSELIFHPDDKEELDFIAQNMQKDNSKKYSVEKIANRIIETQKLDLDPKNKKIFTNILYNFFRNRKSTIITRELIRNSVLIKKVRISDKIVDTVLSIIKSIKNKIDIAGGLVVNNAELITKRDLLVSENKKDIKKVEEKISTVITAQDEIKNALGELSGTKLDKKSIEKKIENKVVGVDLNQEGKKIKKINRKDIKEKVSIEQDKKEEPNIKIKQALSEDKKLKKPALGFSIPSINEDISKKIKPLSGSKDKLVDKKEEISKDVKVSLPKVLRLNIKQEPKKIISDVVIPLKKDEVSSEIKDVSLSQKKQINTAPVKSILMGPVQELQAFDLVGFRRLGDNISERTQKILDKINLLEEESYTKKAQGIAAWRASDVYKLYLQLGVESMAAGKEVADFVSKDNKDILSIEEFSAISDLNKQLRF